MTRSLGLAGNVRPILGAIRSIPVPTKTQQAIDLPPAVPFITISRQPGAGAWTLAGHLVDALNVAAPDNQRWRCWDRELIEKVAGDLHLPAQMIDAIEDRSHSWVADFLASLSFSDDAPLADECKVYSRLGQTIRALALAGRAVIVGGGGVFITRRMPGGIHVRLVAPFEQRVAFMCEQYRLTPDRAAARVKELEHNRQGFFRRYWPNESLGTDTFTVTFNTAWLDMESMVQMLGALVQHRVAARA